MRLLTRGIAPAHLPPGTAWRILLWLALLAMFFQVAHYKPEAGPFYLLSKAWPLLLAPLVLHGAVLRLPDTPLYLVLLAYTLGLTPILSMVHLPNDVADAVMATVKAWPLTFFLSAASALVLLRPSERDVTRAAILGGALTFALLFALWLVVPVAWYQPTLGSNLFSWDEGRGNFIRMPMMLGILTLFWLGHRLAAERRAWQFAAVAAGVAGLVLIYKARLPTGVAVLILALAAFARLGLRSRLGLGALAALPVAAAALVLGPAIPAFLDRTFDESLFIRLRSAGLAWEWTVADPWRLLLGSGSIASSSETTLAEFLRAADFWLTDVGWLGVLFEYGLIGTALIVAVHWRALAAARAVRGADPFRRALADYVLFEILCSAVYSVMYAPGPVVTAAAVAWWLGARDRAGLRGEERGLSRPVPVVEGPTTPDWTRGGVPGAWAPGR